LRTPEKNQSVQKSKTRAKPHLSRKEWEVERSRIILRIAGVSPIHSVTLDGMFSLTMNSDVVIESLLPRLYRRFINAGFDEKSASHRAIGTQIGVLQCLKDKLETYLSRGLEEATNLALLKQCQELRIEFPDVTAFFKRRYRGVFVRRGPKPPTPKTRRHVRETYQTLLNNLKPGFERRGNKIAAIMDAVDFCNARLDSGNTLDFVATVDTFWGCRSSKEVAIKLTSKVCGISISTVKRLSR